MIDRYLNYGRHHIARFLTQTAPFTNVVDLGAGSGVDLAQAAKACPTAERFAIESWPPNIEKLKAHHQVFPLDLEKEPLPFADESIDVVLSNQVLEHVKEIFWIFHQISRVLRVGGHLIIGVPNLASWHNRLLLLCGKQPTIIQNHSAHVRGYTRHDILRLLEMIFPGGYRLRGFGGANFYPFPPLLAKPMARLMPNGAWSIFLLLEKKRSYQEEFLAHPVIEGLETNFYVADARTRYTPIDRKSTKSKMSDALKLK
jgi:SAM-dependent methyltransferase